MTLPCFLFFISASKSAENDRTLQTSSMTLKKTLYALESPLPKEGKLQRFITKYQQQAQKRKCSLKPSLIAELLSYIKRNPVAFNASVAPEKNLCPHCAKAHLLSWAQKEQFPAEEIRCLQKFLPGSSCHHRYYLDGEMLHKVPTM